VLWACYINVVGETLERDPKQRIVAWLADNASAIFVGTITGAEIRRGLERLPEWKRRDPLREWLGIPAHCL